jgi:hypothetical protein
MSVLPLFLWLCLQPAPFWLDQPDLTAKAAKVSVLEVFAEGVLLVATHDAVGLGRPIDAYPDTVGQWIEVNRGHGRGSAA